MASVPYEFTCDKQAGFITNPNVRKCIGYVASLGSFGLATDLLVNVPFNAGAAPHFAGFQSQSSGPPGSAKVVGVIEKFSWDGSVGGAIEIDFWVSQSNAVQLKSLQQMTLKSTVVKSLAWWIGDYDQERKVWYEKAYPHGGSVDGLIQGKANPQLNVNLTPVPVQDGIDVFTYKISLSVVPAANAQYALCFANSATFNAVKSWGLVVGTLASAAIT